MSDVETAARAVPRRLLAVAAIAVGFAAVDTYVVVVALPDMMSSVGLGIDRLQRGAPIVSGFLLGYIAMLPLIGRIADLRGRVPVLVGSLLLFSIGSLVTAASYNLVSMVVGRFLQGIGAGGLVPATLALVADIWVVERRGLPLGVVGAVQELGSVIGPVYGAILIAAWGWRSIFWVNLAVGITLAALLWLLGRPRSPTGEPATRRLDVIGLVLGGLSLLTFALVLTEPVRLTSGLTTGQAFIRYVGDSRWSTPMAAACGLLVIAFALRQLTAREPLLRWRDWAVLARETDVPGGLLLAVALGGVVLAFATSDPQTEILAPAGPWLLAGSALATCAFVLRQCHATRPLLPAETLRARRAWGALAVNALVGASLVAALVDIPVFARVTVYPDSQVDAALVLVRFLIAIPAGALLGGYLVRRLGAATVAAGGMVLAAGAFVLMTQWGATSLHGVTPTFTLLLAGLGFGLAIAPTNAALLAATDSAVHGLASALLVVARMIGMLVGLSVLTAVGLRRFYAVSADQPTLRQTCHVDRICDAYVDQLTQAGIAQMHAIFWAAAGCAAAAAALSLLLLRTPVTAGRGARSPR